MQTERTQERTQVQEREREREFENPFERLLGGTHKVSEMPTPLDGSFAALLDGTVELHKTPPPAMRARKVREIFGTVEMEVEATCETAVDGCTLCGRIGGGCQRGILMKGTKAHRLMATFTVVATEIVWE